MSDTNLTEYLIYDPDQNEVHLRQIRRDQLPFNTQGGAWPAVALDGKYRSVTFDGSGMPVDSFDLETVRRPILRLITAKADDLIASLLHSGVRKAVYDAKEAEARNLKGPTPLLDEEAKGMGISTADLAQQVLANVAAVAEAAQADRAWIGAIEASRRTAQADVLAASTVPALMVAARAAGVA